MRAVVTKGDLRSEGKFQHDNCGCSQDVTNSWKLSVAKGKVYPLGINLKMLNTMMEFRNVCSRTVSVVRDSEDDLGDSTVWAREAAFNARGIGDQMDRIPQ